MNNNDDLLDLCKLNKMEENIANSHVVDRDATMKAIKWKKRQIARKLINNKPTIEKGVMEKHIRENSRDGVYPWTETEVVKET